MRWQTELFGRMTFLVLWQLVIMLTKTNEVCFGKIIRNVLLSCEITEQIYIRLINLVNDFFQDWSINNIFLFLLDDGLSASSCEYEREHSKLKDGL